MFVFYYFITLTFGLFPVFFNTATFEVDFLKNIFEMRDLNVL